MKTYFPASAKNDRLTSDRRTLMLTIPAKKERRVVGSNDFSGSHPPFTHLLIQMKTHHSELALHL